VGSLVETDLREEGDVQSMVDNITKNADKVHKTTRVIVSSSAMIILLTFVVIMVLLFMGTCAVAVAQEVPGAVPLLQGQAAPFDGVLLPPETLEGLLTDKANLQRCKAEKNACRTELDITNKAYEDRVRALTKKLDPGFWRQPETQRWIGFALGVGVAVGATWSAGQLK
jgi:hypothetical protein